MTQNRKSFSVCQFFPDDSYEYVRIDVSAKEAVEAAYHYTHNVASELGITQRVIITDQDDYCVFEWKQGAGVTYPAIVDVKKVTDQWSIH